ncbi:hypothetical protein PT974_01447 [Cladobotryum mycophilum]|uniref:F-box domain-containing protein n=1 Tax=Cladobotryum mycophilum TaxID=491253 RepID=A0ABR0T3R5_9HYPO
MNMGGIRLPPEVIALIISNLSKVDWQHEKKQKVDEWSHLASYAAVSRQLQPYVEAHTFRYVKLTPQRLAEAPYVFTPNRLLYMREVNLEFRLPEHDPRQSRYRYDEYQRVEYNRLFTSFVRASFCFLSNRPWFMAPPMVLYLNAKIPNYEPGIYHRRYARESELPEAGYYLDFHFEDGDNQWLPELPHVTYFRVDDPSMPILINPIALIRIALRFPHLRTLWWKLVDYTTSTAQKIALRNAIADGIGFLPSSITDFFFHYTDPEAYDYGPHEPFISWYGAGDKLSLALSSFAQRRGIMFFDVIGSIEDEDFFPPENVELSTLKHFLFGPQCITPSARWLIVPGVENADEDAMMDDDGSVESDCLGEYIGRCRSVPDPVFFKNILLRAAQIALQMPAMEQITVQLQEPIMMDVIYNAKLGRLKLMYNHGWVPDQDVLDAWQYVVNRTLGRQYRLDLRCWNEF